MARPMLERSKPGLQLSKAWPWLAYRAYIKLLEMIGSKQQCKGIPMIRNKTISKNSLTTLCLKLDKQKLDNISENNSN